MSRLNLATLGTDGKLSPGQRPTAADLSAAPLPSSALDGKPVRWNNTTKQWEDATALLTGTFVPLHGLGDKPFVLVGGDHPYAQWAGNGMAQAYRSRGLAAYLAINTDATSLTPGDTDMLSWSALAQVTAAGHELVAHGARHVQDWSRINTGIQITYSGANATATVQITATQIICTAGGGDSVTLTLFGSTLAQIQTAIQAAGSWTVALAPELTGTESAVNLLQIAATSVKATTVRFAAGGGITVLLTSNTYRHAYVQVASNTLKLWGDGRRLLSVSITGGATLSTIVTAINGISGFTAYLCDNQKAQTPSFESYVSGNELAASLATLDPGAPCVGYPALLKAGLPRWYMIERQLQRCVDQAATHSVTLNGFASSGGAFIQPLRGGHTQFRTFRGNQLNDVDTLLATHVAFPAYAAQTFRPVTSLTSGHVPASSGRLPALVAALADSPGFMVDALMHKVLDDGSSPFDFPSTDLAYYDQTESDFVAYLDALSAQVKAGSIVNLLPSQLPELMATALRPKNNIFNPKFRNSGETLTGITPVNVWMVPGWGVLSPAADQTALTVDSGNSVNITTNTAGERFPLTQLLYLEPGKTYEIGMYVEVLNYSSGSGVSLAIATQRGWARNDGYNQAGFSRSRFVIGTADHVRMLYTVPAPEEMQKARVISLPFGTGIDMSTNKNIKLKFWGKTLDNLDLSAGAASATAVQAVEAAAAINAALTAAAKARTINGEFQNMARSENGQLIVEVPVRAPDGTFQLGIQAATATDISTTVFGSVDSAGFAEPASVQDALLSPLLLKIGHSLAAGTSFKISRPYCQEITVR